MTSKCIGLTAGLLSVLCAQATAQSSTSPGSIVGDRQIPVLAYDSVHDRLLLYGGALTRRTPDGDAIDPDPRTLAWDGRSWSVVAQTGPRSRDEAAYGFDPLDAALYLFGGRGNATLSDTTGIRIAFRETWRFAGNRWTLVDSMGPQPRSSPLGAYNAARRKLVVFGGALGSRGGRGVLATDTWEWDGKQWQRFDVPGPTGRTGHIMAYDAHNKLVIVHGGVRSVDRVALTDTWAWNGESWRLLTMEGPRSIFGAASTAPDSGIVLFGGHTLQGPTRGTWQWDGKTWRNITTEGPAARTFNAMTMDTRRKRVYLLGGTSENQPGTALTDLWYLESGKWVRVY